MKLHRILAPALFSLVLPALQGRAETLWTTVEYGTSTPTLTCHPLSACLVTPQADQPVPNASLQPRRASARLRGRTPHFHNLAPRGPHRGGPAVFVFTPDGKLEAVNFTPPSPGNRTYVVDRVAARLVLVSGPKDNQRCILTRKGA